MLPRSLRHVLIHKFMSETRRANVARARAGDLTWSEARRRQLELIPEVELERVLDDGVRETRDRDPDYSRDALRLKAHTILPHGVEHLGEPDGAGAAGGAGRRSVVVAGRKTLAGGSVRRISLIAPKRRPGPKSNLQLDFNVRVIERIAPDFSAVLREPDESNRSV